MREIKFRLWDEKIPNDISEKELNNPTGGYVNWDYIKKSGYLLDGFNNKYELEQYTGLKDSEGVEIYEGDIVLCGTPKTEKTVIFEDGRFGTRCNSSFYTLNGWVTGGRSIKVVGNIHKSKK